MPIVGLHGAEGQTPLRRSKPCCPPGVYAKQFLAVSVSFAKHTLVDHLWEHLGDGDRLVAPALVDANDDYDDHLPEETASGPNEIDIVNGGACGSAGCRSIPQRS